MKRPILFQFYSLSQVFFLWLSGRFSVIWFWDRTSSSVSSIVPACESETLTVVSWARSLDLLVGWLLFPRLILPVSRWEQQHFSFVVLLLWLLLLYTHAQIYCSSVHGFHEGRNNWTGYMRWQSKYICINVWLVTETDFWVVMFVSLCPNGASLTFWPWTTVLSFGINLILTFHIPGDCVCVCINYEWLTVSSSKRCYHQP